MSILKFAASLLPRIGRDRIEEDIGLLITELNTVTIPALKLAQDSLGKGLKSKEGQAIEKQYRAYSRNPEKGSMIDSIRVRIEASAKLLGVLQSHVEKGFEKDIFIAGLTLRKATALRLIEITSFASLYTLRLLNYLYIMEANTVGAEHYVTDNMSPGEIKRIKGHVYEFATALNAVGQPTDKAQKTLDTIPEVLVGPEFQSTVSAFGAGTTDPFVVATLSGFTYNPIYHIGLIVGEYQSTRAKQARELRSMLELRALYLVRQKTNNPDAGLDQEIAVVRGRIDRLSESLRKFEESME